MKVFSGSVPITGFIGILVWGSDDPKAGPLLSGAAGKTRPDTSEHDEHEVSEGIHSETEQLIFFMIAVQRN